MSQRMFKMPSLFMHTGIKRYLSSASRPRLKLANDTHDPALRDIIRYSNGSGLLRGRKSRGVKSDIPSFTLQQLNRLLRHCLAERFCKHQPSSVQRQFIVPYRTIQCWYTGRWSVGCYIWPSQAPPRCTKCNSPPINGRCTKLITI